MSYMYVKTGRGILVYVKQKHLGHLGDASRNNTNGHYIMIYIKFPFTRNLNSPKSQGRSMIENIVRTGV